MTLYNVLFGKNRLSTELLKILGLGEDDVSRYRDCYLKDKQTIVIYTRTGGANRDDYAEANGALAKHPHYIRDEDDDFDSTYASFEFQVPPAFDILIAAIFEDLGEVDTLPPKEKWRRLITKMEQNDTEDPEVKHALDVGRDIFSKISAAFSEVPLEKT